MAKQYDIYYRVHSQEFGWLGWAKNGESAGTEGYSYRLRRNSNQLVKKQCTRKYKLLFFIKINNQRWY